MNMHISNASNQVHELAPPTCVLLLSKNIDPPQYCSSWSMSMIALSSHLPLCHPRIIHIFVHFSPPLSSMTIKRAEATWNLPCEDQWLPLEVVPLVLVGLPLEVVPLVGNHMKRLWFDTKSWTWVDGWVLNLHFWWTLSSWLELTPLVTTTCGSMKTTLKCHM